METRSITKADFDHIVEVVDRWWGGAPMSTLVHPIFFYELGHNALVMYEGEKMTGFLLGFMKYQEPKTGYVHLVGIHPDYRRRGVGRMLYKTFTERCQAAGCQRMKAITTLGNEGSIRFHASLGWKVEELDDYAGPGRKRVVFTRDL
mgnify:CR=1 FL=1